MELYQINSGKLTPVPLADVYKAGLKETADLESWVRDAERIFDRDRVLWISRQERTTADERADLVGICHDELLLVELKRGTVGKEAVAQALSYLSRVAKRDRQQLLDLYAEQAAKTGQWALLSTPLDRESAEKRFAEHEPKEGGVNQFQTIILVGTEFLPETLQVCGFLNEHLANSTLTVECWQLYVFQNGAGYLCSFDKLLPSRDVEAEIEERRETQREGKYKRDQNRIALMHKFKGIMWGTPNRAKASPGQSYECYVEASDLNRIYLDIYGEPKIWVPTNSTAIDHAALAGEPGATNEVDNGDQYLVIPMPIKDWADGPERESVANRAATLVRKALRLP